MRFVPVNWIGQFFKAFVFGFVALASLSICLIAAGAGPQAGATFLVSLLFIPLFGYLAVGAALNGARAFSDTFRVRYGWRRDK